MPNRILRDGILTSEAVCSLSWGAEVLYRRLMSVADDHGRFHATHKLIRAACYPHQIDKVSDADVGKWIAECEKAALVSVYPAQDGKRYLQIAKFGQQVRSKSKFPEPSCDPPLAPASNCEQPPANAHLGVFVSEGVSVVEGEGEKPARKRADPPDPKDCPDDVDAQVWTDWLTLRKQKRAPVTLTVIEGAKTEASKAGMSLEDFLRVWCRRGSQGLEAAWLKPEERGLKTARQAEVAKWLGPLAQQPKQGEIIDMEDGHGPRIAMG